MRKILWMQQLHQSVIPHVSRQSIHYNDKCQLQSVGLNVIIEEHQFSQEKEYGNSPSTQTALLQPRCSDITSFTKYSETPFRLKAK